MKVLVCAATLSEYSLCIKEIRKNKLEDTFEVLKTGVGFQNARTALQQRLRDKNKVFPDLVLSTGFAGSCSSNLKPGDWIQAEKIYLEETKELAAKEIPFYRNGKRLMAESIHLLTTNELNTSYRSLQADITVSAVDMESAVLAQICNQYRIPFHVLRYITDSVENPFPSFVKEIASGMAEKQILRKFNFYSKGVAGAFSDLRGVVNLVKNSKTWNKEFSRGFSERLKVFLA